MPMYWGWSSGKKPLASGITATAQPSASATSRNAPTAPAPVRTLGCAATRRSPALTDPFLSQLVVWRILRRPQDAALVRSRVTPHGLSLRPGRSGAVSAGLLHLPAGDSAGWRHEAQRRIEVGPGASSSPFSRGGLHRVQGFESASG